MRIIKDFIDNNSSYSDFWNSEEYEEISAFDPCISDLREETFNMFRVFSLNGTAYPAVRAEKPLRSISI